MVDVARGFRRLVVLLRWRRHQTELAEEIATHEALHRDAFRAQGMSDADAAAAARRAMGQSTQSVERAREAWRFGWLRDAAQDTTYALRALRRSPAFAVVAILGLAFGLGFSSAVFTGFHAFAMRGWDVREPSRMVSLAATWPTHADEDRPTGFSLDEMRAFAENARTLDGVTATLKTRPDGTGDITAAPVSASYFQVLGVPMVRGRAFTADDDRLGAAQRVLVVSHRYWRSALDSSPNVIGASVRVSGVPFTVIGVAREGFDGTNVIGVDAWIPLAAMPIVRPKDERSRGALTDGTQCCVELAARLAPGVTADAASAELSTLLRNRARPGIDTIPRAVTALPFTFAGTGGPKMIGEVRTVFLMLGGGVAAVLLLACANVANLLLARATARQREITIRLALGASRGRLVRQLMTESLLLALLASIPALYIAAFAPGWILSFMTDQQHTMRFSTDPAILLFTVSAAIVCCVCFGLAPALHASKPLVSQRQRLPLRSVFLSAQVAFCVVLLVGAALFVRSATIDNTTELGFATADVTELRVTLPATIDEAVGGRRLRADLPELAARVGARRVAYSESPPFFTSAGINYRARAGGESRFAGVVHASPDYFSVLGVPLQAGRLYRADDSLRYEVVVNPAMAEQFGGVQRAIGASIILGDDERWTIVGVTAPTHDVGLRTIHPAVYRMLPWVGSVRVIVRGDVATARALAAAIAERDPSLLVVSQPYRWYVDQAKANSTFGAMVSGLLGLLALVLATIGMFGVLSYWVQQRQGEIGVRMALGATPATVVRLVMGASGRAVGWGLGIGLVVAVGAAQLLRSVLFGLSPLDPIAYGGALAVLVVAAVAATLIPARRAVAVDPMRALRET